MLKINLNCTSIVRLLTWEVQFFYGAILYLIFLNNKKIVNYFLSIIISVEIV